MASPDGTTPPEAATSPPPAWFSQPCILGIGELKKEEREAWARKRRRLSFFARRFQPCLPSINQKKTDEAGRGPVLGSMVYGAAIAPLADKEALAGGRFADSKMLTEAAREAAHAALLADPRMAWRVSALSGYAISSAMLGRGGGTSLNALAWESTIALLDGALKDGAALAEVFVDTVGDPETWANRLRARYPGVTFTVCPKADALFPIVSAASIVAKVTRDREVVALAAAAARQAEAASSGAPAPTGPAALTLGPPLPMGSGYPGDPITKAWLEGAVDPVFGFPACVRFSWATVANALAPPKGAAVAWEDDDGAPGAGQGRLGFGGRSAGGEKDTGGPSVGTGRPSYFRARRLQRVALA